MNSLIEAGSWEFIPIFPVLSRGIEIFDGASGSNIGNIAGSIAMGIAPERLDMLTALARKVLWLSSWTIHHANHVRPSTDGLKVGGHQASSASLANIMSALYFSVLRHGHCGPGAPDAGCVARAARA